MKKIFGLLLALTLCFVFVGCKEKKNPVEEEIKELEKMSGVKQPVIARMETGSTSPQLDTILKILAPLGKTLAVVPIAGK